jgi:hypothetical protein
MFRRRFGLLVMLAALFVGGLAMGTASASYAADPATGSGTANNPSTPDIPNLPATEFIQVKNSPINFPFLSPSIEQRSILLNAFKFQSGLFAGLSGVNGANSIAIRSLGILAAIVGALLIFFFPKYQKANVIIPWLLVVTITVMAPYNSKLLFYPANSDEKTMSCGTDANIAKCGFTPQLVAIHLAATMQRILSDLFVQQDWVDLISEVGADASMSGAMGAAYFTLGDEWPDLVNRFNSSCSDAARTQAVMDTVRGQTNENNLATAIPTFGDFWDNEVKKMYVDSKVTEYGPPIAVLYTEIPEAWQKDVRTKVDDRILAYTNGIFAIYKYAKDRAGKPVETHGVTRYGDTDTYSIAKAIEEIKAETSVHNFFGAFDEYGRIAPGFFFSIDKDLANGGTSMPSGSEVSTLNNESKSVARACYYQPGNALMVCDSRNDVSQRDAHAIGNQKGDMKRVFQNPDNATDAWQAFLTNVLPTIRSMPIGIAEFTVNQAKIPLGTPAYFDLKNDAIGFTPSTKGGRNCTDMFRQISNIVVGAESGKCREQAALNASGGGDSYSSACNTDQKSLLSHLKPYLVPEIGAKKDLPTNNKFTPDMINGYGSENGSVIDDNGSQAAREGAEFANKIAAIMSAELRNARINKASDDVARYRLLGKLISYASKHTIQDKKQESEGNKKAADAATEINPVLMGNGALRLFGLGAFELGKIGTGVVAFITGGVAQAFVMFLAVLVDMALMAIIIMTPILFVFGLIMPSAAAGVLTVAVLGTFLLKLVPATLIILNALGGLMYVFIMDGVDSSNASFMGNVLIIAMSGLYMNIVGMTFFMIFKIGSPEAILGRLQGLDKGAKEMAEAGRGMAIAALGIAGAATAAGVGSALGNEVLKNRMKNKLIDMVPGGRDMMAAIDNGDPTKPNNLTTDDKNLIRNQIGKPLTEGGKPLTKDEAEQWIGSGSRDFTLDDGSVAKVNGTSDGFEIKPSAAAIKASDASEYDTTKAATSLEIGQKVTSGGGDSVLPSDGKAAVERTNDPRMAQVSSAISGHMDQATESFVVPLGEGGNGVAKMSLDQAAALEARGGEKTYFQNGNDRFYAEVNEEGRLVGGKALATDSNRYMNENGEWVDSSGSPTGTPPLGGTGGSGTPPAGSPLSGGPSGSPATGGTPMAVFVQGGQLESVGAVSQMATGADGLTPEQRNNQQAPTGNTASTQANTPPVPGSAGEEINRRRIQAIASAQEFLDNEKEFANDADVQAKKKALRDHLASMEKAQFINDDAFAKHNSLKNDYLQSLRVAGDKSAVGITDFSQLGIKRNKNIENSAEQLQAMREQAKTKVQELERTNPALAKQYQKFYDDTVTANPLAGGMGERFQRLAAEGERLDRINRLTKDLTNSPGFLKALGSGIYGSFAGSAGGVTSIPILGRMIKESLNEYMEGPERARAWNTVGGFGKMWTMRGDAQRLGFFQKAVAPAAAGETYQQMWTQGTFQAQADLARQAAVEAVARQRSQYDVLQWQLGKMNSDPGNNGPQRTNIMNAEDLRGIGSQDAMGKIRTLYAESVDMRKGVFNIEIPEFDAKGNLITMARQDVVRDERGNAVRNAKGELQFAAPTVRKNLETLGEIYAGLAQKDVSSKTGDLLVKHYGIYEKRFNRHAKGWNETRDLVNSEAAMNAFTRMDVDTDYQDEGFVKMFEGKERFFGYRGKYKAYKELMNRENQEIAERMQEKMGKIQGMDVTAKFNITPTTVLTDAKGNAFKPADLLKQVNEEIGKENMIFQTVFENSFKTGYRNVITKSSRKDLFAGLHKEAAAMAKEISGIFTNVAQGIDTEVVGAALDDGLGPDAKGVARQMAKFAAANTGMKLFHKTSGGATITPADIVNAMKETGFVDEAFEGAMEKYFTSDGGINWSLKGTK